MCKPTLRAFSALAIACSCASPAIADEWWLVASSDSGLHLFVDRESIRAAPSEVGRARALVAWSAYFEKGKDGKAYQSSLEMIAVDCAEESNALRQYTNYDANGVVTYSSGRIPIDWRYLPPGTLGESRLRFICNYTLGAGEVTSFAVGDDTFVYVSNPLEAASR